ncbi:hypothetical protein CVT24_002219, partial [Panaeolus cyanescens]
LFVQAAEWNLVAAEHVYCAISAFFQLPPFWDKFASSTKLSQLMSACTFLAVAHGNTCDAQKAYEEVKQALQELFDGLIAEHGTDAPIRVEKRHARTGNLVIEHSTIAQVTSSVLQNLSDAENMTRSLTSWILEFYQMIQSFLQDENATLDIPLDEVPFISSDWNDNRRQCLLTLRDGKIERDKVQSRHPELLTLQSSNLDGRWRQDLMNRKPFLQTPPPKLKIPALEPILNAKATLSTPFPTTLFSSRLTSGGNSEMNLVNIDQSTPGQTCVNVSFTNVPLNIQGAYHAITVRCGFSAVTPSTLTAGSFQLIDQRPKTGNDVIADPTITTGDWRPTVKTSFNSAGVVWRFSNTQGIFPISTSLPARDSAEALDVLQSYVSLFVQAAEWNLVAAEHIYSAISVFFLLPPHWDDVESSVKLSKLMTTCHDLALAHANTCDSKKMYEEVKQALQKLFDRLIAEYGANTPIRVEKRQTRTGDLNIEHSTIVQITSSVLQNLSDAENMSRSLTGWILEFYQMIQSFLQDENATLDIPLNEVPFISSDWKEKYQNFLDSYLVGKVERDNVQSKYPELLTLHSSNIDERCGQDQMSRKPLLQTRPPKRKVSDSEPEPTMTAEETVSTLFPTTLFSSQLTPGGYSEMNLLNIDQTIPGQTLLNVSFTNAPRDNRSAYHAITIRCQFNAVTPSTLTAENFQMVDHRPKTAKEIVENATINTVNWRPTVKTYPNPAGVEWRFSQSVIPIISTSLSADLKLTLTFKHTVDLRIFFDVRIVHWHWMLWKTKSKANTSIVIVA